VADRKPFLLRLDPHLFDALQRWANDEVRSLNGQIEFLLTRALREAGRVKAPGGAPARLPRAKEKGGDR
jgi:hypothetical protein